MKPTLFSVFSLFIWSQSLAQSTSGNGDIIVRNGRGTCIYYIDGIKVRGSQTDSIKATEASGISIITGGLPVNYGDLNSSMIRIGSTPPTPAVKSKSPDKIQNLPTE